MGIIKRIDHSHWSRQGPFDGLLGLLTQKLRIFDKNRFWTRYATNDCWYTCIIAIPYSDSLALLEIDAVEVFDKRSDEMLARLLAIADDIDARLPLIVESQAQGILLSRSQFLILQFPWRPKFLWLRKPGGFWQAAGGGRRQKCFQDRLTFWFS